MRLAISSSLIRYINSIIKDLLNQTISQQSHHLNLTQNGPLRIVLFFALMPPKSQKKQSKKQTKVESTTALKKKSPCGSRCSKHRFQMEKIQKDPEHLKRDSRFDASLRMCPQCGDQKTLVQPYPVYQNDKLPYTIAFELGLDHKRIASNLGHQLKMFNHILSRAREIDIIDNKPRITHKTGICNICEKRFDSYNDHVNSKQHLDKLEAQQFNKYLIEFCQNFRESMKKEQKDKKEGKIISKKKNETDLLLQTFSKKKQKKEPEIIQIFSNTPDIIPNQPNLPTPSNPPNLPNQPNIIAPQKNLVNHHLSAQRQQTQRLFEYYFEQYRQRYGDNPPQCICNFKQQPAPIKESRQTKFYRRVYGERQLDLDDFEFRIKQDLLPKRRKNDPLTLSYRKWQQWKTKPQEHQDYKPEEDPNIVLLWKWLRPKDEERDEVMAEIEKGNRSSQDISATESNESSANSQKIDKYIDERFEKFRTADRFLKNLTKKQLQEFSKYIPSKDVWSRKKKYNREQPDETLVISSKKRMALKSKKIFVEDAEETKQQNKFVRQSPFADDEETNLEDRLKKKVKQQEKTNFISINQPQQTQVEQLNPEYLKPLETEQDEKRRQSKRLYKKFIAFVTEKYQVNESETEQDESDQEEEQSEHPSQEPSPPFQVIGGYEQARNDHDIFTINIKYYQKQYRKNYREERRKQKLREQEQEQQKRRQRRREKKERKLMRQEEKNAILAQLNKPINNNNGSLLEEPNNLNP